MKQLNNEAIDQLALSLPNPQGTSTPVEGPSGIPTGGLEGHGTNIIQVTINLLFVFGIIIAIVFIFISGIQWIISGGEKQKLQNARNRLVYSFVGLIVITIAFAIVNIIVTLIGGNPKFFLNTQNTP